MNGQYKLLASLGSYLNSCSEYIRIVSKVTNQSHGIKDSGSDFLLALCTWLITLFYIMHRSRRCPCPQEYHCDIHGRTIETALVSYFASRIFNCRLLQCVLCSVWISLHLNNSWAPSKIRTQVSNCLLQVRADQPMTVLSSPLSLHRQSLNSRTVLEKTSHLAFY